MKKAKHRRIDLLNSALVILGLEEEYQVSGTKDFPVLVPSAQRFVWAAKQPLGKAALGTAAKSLQSCLTVQPYEV